MSEAVAEKDVCEKCGAEVREGTMFCYACGGRVASDEVPKTNGSLKVDDEKSRSALDELAEKLKIEDPPAKPQGQFAKAAEQRNKARVAQRKTRDFVWEPQDDVPLALLISVAVVAVGALLVVLVTVVWK